MRSLVLLVLLAVAASTQAMAPEWAATAPVYEVNLEQFSDQGFAGLQARLPELKRLGIGILWLMPIHPRGVLKGFGSPYCVQDFRGIYTPYGSADDLKKLVDAVHRQGMYIILDWVGNHSSWDNPLITYHPEFYAKDKAGKISQAHEWADVAQFDYSNPGLRQYMLESLKYWVTEFDIDGYRCDVAWGIPADFWMQARIALEAIKPIYLLAEADKPELQGAFDSDYDWSLMNSGKSNLFTDIAHGLKPASDIDALLASTEKRYAPGFQRLHYTSNHDEWKDNGTVFARLGLAYAPLAVLSATLPGKPLLYNGQEIGWPQQKGIIDWKGDALSATYFEFYQKLLSAYSWDRALFGGQFRKLKSSDDSACFAYIREYSLEKALVFLNLSGKPQSFSFNDPDIAGDYTELFSQSPAALKAAQVIELKAWDYRVYEGRAAKEAIMRPTAWSLDRVAKAVAACSAKSAKAQSFKGQGIEVAFKSWHDAKALHVAVDVCKSHPMHDSPNDKPWEDDSVEVYLDLKHDKAHSYGDDDFQYIVGYQNPQVFEPRGRLEGVVGSSKATDCGYSIELALPFKTLGIKPDSKAVYGFDIGVNIDRDGNARDASLQWSGDADNYHDTQFFGELRLSSCK